MSCKKLLFDSKEIRYGKYERNNIQK